MFHSDFQHSHEREARTQLDSDAQRLSSNACWVVGHVACVVICGQPLLLRAAH